jgi:hypothetical protein
MHFQGEKSHYRRYKKATMTLESASGRGFIMPKNAHIYSLVIDRDSHWGFKNPVLKILMTIAERIAEW